MLLSPEALALSRSPNAPLLSHPGPRIPFSPCVSLGTSQTDRVLRLSLLPTAVSRTSGQALRRKSIPGGLSGVVLTVRRGSQIGVRKTTEVKRLLMTAHRGALPLSTLTLVTCLVSICQVSPLCGVSFPVHLLLFVGGHCVQPTSQKWGVCPPTGAIYLSYWNSPTGEIDDHFLLFSNMCKVLRPK